MTCGENASAQAEVVAHLPDWTSTHRRLWVSCGWETTQLCLNHLPCCPISVPCAPASLYSTENEESSSWKASRRTWPVLSPGAWSIHALCRGLLKAAPGGCVGHASSSATACRSEPPSTHHHQFAFSHLYMVPRCMVSWKEADEHHSHGRWPGHCSPGGRHWPQDPEEHRQCEHNVRKRGRNRDV